MFGSLFVAALLCAQGDVKLAAPGFSKSGLTQEQAQFFSGHLAARLSSTPWLQVVSSDDIAQMIGLERQRELLGCADGKASCMAELAGALGVDGMLVGQVAKVGQSFQVNVKVMDPAGSPLFVYSSERLGTEEAVLDELNRIAGLIAEKLAPMHDKRMPAGTVTAVSAAPKPTFWPALGVAGAGVVVLAGAALCWVNVSQEWGSLQRATMAGSNATLLEATTFATPARTGSWRAAFCRRWAARRWWAGCSGTSCTASLLRRWRSRLMGTARPRR